MHLDVSHNRSSSRFVLELGDGEEAYLAYREREDGRLDYAHTFVPEEHRGEGIAEELVLTALEYARADGRQIIPSCPYVRHVIEERHPDYGVLVAAENGSL